MRNTKLIINGKLANFRQESDLSPRIVFQQFDVENLSLAAGDYTLNLKLPKDKHNIFNIFNFINELDNSELFWYQKSYRAVIEIDGDTVLSGNLTVDSITNDDFVCTIIGDNINFAEQLESSLRDIKSFRKVLFSGVRSSNYNPFPNQYPDSIAYREIWLDLIGQNSILEETDLYDFAMPLVSYGNFPAPSTFSDPLYLIDSTSTAAEGAFVFYNTAQDPMNWGSMFPSPYLVTTIKRIFEDYNYNVGGDFFNKPFYKNIVIPFTSPDLPPWNWGLLARLDVDFIQVSTGSVLQINSQRFTGGNWNQLSSGGKTQQFVRLTSSSIGDAPATEVIKENYTYLDEFNLINNSLDNKNYGVFYAPTTGKYHIRYEMNGISARNQLFQQANIWNLSASANDRFFFILVNRETNDFQENGTGYIYWDNFTNTYRTIDDVDVTAPGLHNSTNTPGMEKDKVIAVFTYDVNSGAYDSMTSTSRDFYIEGIADLEWTPELSTIELIFVVGDGPNNLLGSFQTISIDTPLFSNNIWNLTVTPLEFETELNPALFLPDISQKDFLKTILNTYNLFLFYDRNSNTILLNEYDNYFLPNSTAVDWSDKASLLDESLNIKAILQYKNTDFKLTEDTEDFIQYLSQVPTNKSYINESNFYQDTKTIELLHSWTQNINYYATDNSGDIHITNMNLPTMSSKDVNEATLFELYEGDVIRTYDFQLRLLKYKGIFSAEWTKELWIEDIAYFYDEYNAPSFFWPLAVQEDTSTLFNPRFVGDNNLFIAWKKYLDLLNKSVLVTLDAYLISSDISTLDIRKPIKIGNSLFIINKINEYNPVELTTTQIQLYKK